MASFDCPFCGHNNSNSLETHCLEEVGDVQFITCYSCNKLLAGWSKMEDGILDNCPKCSSSTSEFTLGEVTTAQCNSCNIICSVIVAESLWNRARLNFQHWIKILLSWVEHCRWRSSFGLAKPDYSEPMWQKRRETSWTVVYWNWQELTSPHQQSGSQKWWN